MYYQDKTEENILRDNHPEAYERMLLNRRAFAEASKYQYCIDKVYKQDALILDSEEISPDIYFVIVCTNYVNEMGRFFCKFPITEEYKNDEYLLRHISDRTPYVLAKYLIETGAVK